MSVAIKLTFARFVNTAIVPIIVNFSFDKWFMDGGLIMDVFYLLLAISFVEPIAYYFDVFYFLRRVLKAWNKWKGKDCTLNQA